MGACDTADQESTTVGTDCDDAVATINPSALTEVADDGTDQDCSGFGHR